MINDNYVYVDKTHHIFHLINNSRYCFFSRPRRFGKSLLVSTLKEVFSGNKELFKDLALLKTDYKWLQYPVITIDFSRIAHATPEDLKSNLGWKLEQIAKSYKKDVSSAPSVEAKLEQLVSELSAINKVVILIDEYDYPILSHLDTISIALQQQEILRSFYTTIKGLNEYLHFIFITGVSKFSKTSLFSGLNNLDDISNSSLYGSLLGYIQQELEESFKEYIDRSSQRDSTSVKVILKELKVWYNGYRFSPEDIKVYNPYSLLLYFQSNLSQNYWFETGTPSFLINLLRHKYKTLGQIAKGTVTVNSLGSFNIQNVPPITILF